MEPDHLVCILTWSARRDLITPEDNAIERWLRNATGLNTRQERMVAELPVQGGHSTLSRLAATPWIWPSVRKMRYAAL